MSNITRAERLADKLLADAWSENGAVQFTTSMLCVSELRRLAESERALLDALQYAEAALADIGDADREPGDDLAWCEGRATEALPRVREVIAATKEARQ